MDEVIIEHNTPNDEEEQVASQVASESGENRNKRLPKSPSTRPRSQKRQKTTATEEALSIMREVQGRSALVPDQFKCFGDQVGLRIRDLPSSNAQTIVKYLISNILFEAEMGKYNNGNLSTATYSQPLYPMTNYTQQQYSVPVTPAHPKSNRHFEQLSTSGRMQMTSPQSAMSSVSSAHSSTDYDSIDNILMEL